MQFTVSFEVIYRYWNRVHTKHENMFSRSLESEQKQCREYMQVISVEVFIYLFFFLSYKTFFVGVKGWTCLRIAIQPSSSTTLVPCFIYLLKS